MCFVQLITNEELIDDDDDDDVFIDIHVNLVIKRMRYRY